MASFVGKKVGWIGTGVMGNSMCQHLLNKGIDLSVYTRTKSKAQNLLKLGAKWASIESIASDSDVVILMLGYPKDVEQICFGESLLVKNMKKGSFLIDHTTSQPSLAQTISDECKKYGVRSIDAPVTGGDIGAKEGRLVTLCGGEEQDFKEVKELLEVYSRSVERFGLAGRGQHAKLTNQIILAGNMIGMAEGLLYASKMGLNLDHIINTIKQGAAGSTALGVLGQRAADGNFDPGFYVEHYVKDMKIALEECERANICLPGLALVKQLYTALMAQGGSKLGTQALLKVLENINNHKIHEAK